MSCQSLHFHSTNSDKLFLLTLYCHLSNFESKAFTIRDLKAVYHDGDYEISGTIKNITNETITGAAITIVFYNSEERVQTNVHPISSDLEPRQEYSFDISPYRIGLELDHYKITMMSDR